MKPFFAPWTIPGERPLVRFDNVTKRFGAAAAVDQLSLDIYEREFLALLGPSGCGKSTLLRLLAGFEAPDSGRIQIAGEDVANVPPYRRPVNMMFQNYALFPHLTVAGNIAFGLRQEGLPRAEIKRRVEEMLSLVALEQFARRKPHQLSGGQRQRVALARSLAKRPKVLLLDEPMAALDRKLRAETQFELLKLQQSLGMTFIIVTHDQDEAMSLAHRIAVMNEGRLLQLGPPADVYEQPDSCWVANFVGEANLIEGVINAVDGHHVTVTASGGETLRAITSGDIWPGTRAFVAVRPEKIAISMQELPAGSVNCLAGHVVEASYLGEKIVYRVRLASGVEIKAAVANVSRISDLPLSKDDPVWLLWTPDAGVALDH
ncbi:MAG: ABC transporter ATP-binding protein [Tardiphaga sp.]